MGLFGLFGGKNSSEKIDTSAESAAAAQLEKEIQEARQAHAEMTWPDYPKLNPVNIELSAEEAMIETVTADRKNAIGELAYDPDIASDTLQAMSGQELLFLLTVLEVFNKTAPLPGFEKNHRKVYNEILSRIRDAEKLYVLYDISTGYPFIDHGFVNVYFEKEVAERAVILYAKQFRILNVREVLVENPYDTAAIKRGFFDYLYYIGIENLLIDNGAYRARFRRNEIVAAPGDWNNEDNNRNPINPALNFAMLDFLAEARWHVTYEKRDEVIKAKEMRMLSIIRNSSFIIPMQHEGPVDVSEDGRMKFSKDTKFKFLMLNVGDGKQFIPVFTDAIEFGKKLRGTEWNAAVFRYQDVLRFAQDKDGITINPDGQALVLPRERMELLEAAGQHVDQIKGIKPTDFAQKLDGNPDDAEVKRALDKALVRLNEQKED